MHDWWIDELAHAGAEHLDPDYVAGYDRKARYDPGDDVDTLGRHGLGADSTVLDLGAGTGASPLRSRRCRRVVAVDVSPAMVRRPRAAGSPPGSTTSRLCRAGSCSYEHEGTPVGPRLLPQRAAPAARLLEGIALDRIARACARAACSASAIWCSTSNRARQTSGSRLDGGRGRRPGSGWTADELAEHVRIEYSTYSWLFEPMLERTGFEILERDYVRGAYGAYTLRRRCGALVVAVVRPEEIMTDNGFTLDGVARWRDALDAHVANG